MPVETKNQIRPRRRKWRFSNAEILALDTTGLLLLIPPPGLGYGLAITQIQLLAKIDVVYGNIDATNPFLIMFDDFSGGVYIEDIATSSTQNFSGLLGSFTGLNCFNYPSGRLEIDDSGTFNECGPHEAGWSDYADMAANGGIYFLLSNGGADLNGGDPANFLDVFVEYNIVNLITG